jgi:Asp-tRNA(Asn)/Glu-tRNA(Gln) amidotransferase C subunit
MLKDVAIPGDTNVIKKEAEKILKYVERNNKCDTSNNRGNWNHFKIIQKIPEQRTGNPRSQGATENSHIGHGTHTAESTNVKAQ